MPYYESIRLLRQSLVNTHTQGSIFDLPPAVRDSFRLLQDFTDTITTISEGSDLWVTLRNCHGHLLRVAKQLLSVAPESKAPIEEEEQKYKAFFEPPAEAGITQIDFSDQDAICDRQERLLAVLNEKTAAAPRPLELIRQLGPWAILLCEGGHFALGVFRGKELVDHRSDKKFLVRKMPGKRQANGGKTKKLAEGQLRREMDRVHQEHVATVMAECTAYFAQARVIFLHAPGVNRQFFLAEGMPLRKHAGKVRPVTMRIGKANFGAVMGIFEKLTTARLSW